MEFYFERFEQSEGAQGAKTTQDPDTDWLIKPTADVRLTDIHFDFRLFGNVANWRKLIN